MSYMYYPGCSLETTHKAYDKSSRAVFKALGTELKELDDWNCCGATFYMSIKEITSLAIAARNLAIAEKNDCDLIAPCSSCYTILNKANRFIKGNSELKDKVNECLKEDNLSYEGSVNVRHPLDVLVNDIGLEIIQLYLKTKLSGLKIANYYGCQIVRPEKGFDDRENPTSMENLFESIGAENIYYPCKLRCCGGMLMTTYEETALKLSEQLLLTAQENGADCIVTTCPLCQMNLEAYQQKINKVFNRNYHLPIFFFTQILGVALGIDDEELGLNLNFYECSALKQIQSTSALIDQSVISIN